MLIQLFEHHKFVPFLSIPLPQTFQELYSKIESEKKIAHHKISLFYNGELLPQRGLLQDYNITDKSIIRIVLPIPPSLNEILPLEGPCGGGTRVCLTGYFPYSGRKYKVTFGCSEVQATYLSHKELIVLTPPHDPGVVDVKVCYEGGDDSDPTLFTFITFGGIRRK
ncbi:IPT/TIG domain-containing protein [Entamoeba marina]